MSVYLDASLLVALFTQEAFTARVRSFLASQHPVPVVSDFAAAEFASALARLVRTRELTGDDADTVCANFDVWRARGVEIALVMSSDVQAATVFLRRRDLTLRTADTINIAIAQRLDAALATFDVKMAAGARALGLQVADAQWIVRLSIRTSASWLASEQDHSSLEGAALLTLILVARMGLNYRSTFLASDEQRA